VCVFPHVHNFCMREGKGGAWEFNHMQGNSRALNLAVGSGPKKGWISGGLGHTDESASSLNTPCSE
jgi:hypothetical protein